ncbi:MAG: hypothetical protein JWO00_137 [Candidatus Parcubacteria bacterium]|nr:hypothetical protein [Candidatus Parcubacteria bacterium]
MHMKKIALILGCLFAATILVVAVLVAVLVPARYSTAHVPTRTRGFDIQSVDVMKYSRDTAREKLGDSSFDSVIDEQVKSIAELGATHVAIGTPYDPEFLPFLKRWVAAARKYNLSVWFRGNFSGWEGWFEYPRLTRAQHVVLVGKFIRSNPDLFQDGDIFSPCPECENGGSGDPRKTGDVDAYRQFLTDEFDVSNDAFLDIGKKVESGYFSMNSDVAHLIMDKGTIARLGGIVSIDHYVKDVSSMNDAIAYFSGLGAQVVVSEFGAPIPDLNGNMSQDDQAKFVASLFSVFYRNNQVVRGVNYWVVQGGSTAILNDNGTKRLAFDTVKEYYKAPLLMGTVVDAAGMPLQGAQVSLQEAGYSGTTDRWGNYEVFAPFIPDTLVISREGFASTTMEVQRAALSINSTTTLAALHPTMAYRIQSFLFGIRERFGW